jgi:fatty acid desaturase
MALWLWVLSHWIANAFVINSGMYVQHSGCVAKTPAEPVRHSIVFVSNFFNLTMFNIGFHLEHHENPRVHWSELPELHQRLKPEFVHGERMWFPLGTTMQPFYSRGTRIAENDSTSRTRDTQAVDHRTAL